MSFNLKILGTSSPLHTGQSLECLPPALHVPPSQTEMQHRSEEPTWLPRFYPHISCYQPRCRSEGLLVKSRIKVYSHSRPLFMVFRLSKACNKISNIAHLSLY